MPLSRAILRAAALTAENGIPIPGVPCALSQFSYQPSSWSVWWVLPPQLQVCCWTVLTLLCLWLQFWAGATPLGYVGFGFGIASLIQLLRGRRRMHQITAVFSVVSAAISDV